MLDFSWPGKPTDNSFIGSFNGKFRSECLKRHFKWESTRGFKYSSLFYGRSRTTRKPLPIYRTSRSYRKRAAEVIASDLLANDPPRITR